jgi:uncharacterized protein (TIGR02996 family)
MRKNKTSKSKFVEAPESPGLLSDQEALLASVLAEPEEDTPRLIYADWLEENGFSERAEFIRIQCEIAKWEGTNRNQFQTARLLMRCDALLKQYSHAWREELCQHLQVDPYLHLQFRRGFVEILGCRTSWFIDSGAKLFDLTPLRRVSLRRATLNEIQILAQCAHLERVTHLRFDAEEIGDEGVRILVRTPRVRKLKSLELSCQEYDPFHHLQNHMTKAALAISQSPHLSHLELLDLRNCNIGDEAALAILGSPYLKCLERLNVIHNVFSASVLALLQQRFGDGLRFTRLDEIL